MSNYVANISSKNPYNTSLTSVQPYTVAVTSEQPYNAILLTWTHSALSFKTYSNIPTDYIITYTGSDNPIWTDGTDTFYGASVTFPWTTTAVKQVHVYVEKPELVTADFYSDTTIFELNVSRITTARTTITLNNASLRRLYTPINSAITLIESELGIEAIEVLNCAASAFTDIEISLWRSFNLYSFIQPKAAWSASRFHITNSVIYDTLDLSNLTINGSLSLVDNFFIEEITLNPDADWTLCTSFKIDNSTLLNYVDLYNKNGLLTPNDSAIAITDIGASQSQVDEMLHALSTIIPNNSATGRVVRLTNNTAPSATGLIYKAAIEALGVTVYTD